MSENLKKNGPWLTYRLPKRGHKGGAFIQLEPLEFIDKVARFIPPPKAHRRTYHGVFAANSKVRLKIVKLAMEQEEKRKPPSIEETLEKTKKVLLGWAKLIARIYEVNPLICSCGALRTSFYP